MTEWISVEDRFPNDGERVNVFTADERVLEMTYDKRRECWSRYDSAGVCSLGQYFITHWQPLPKPPKAKSLLDLRDDINKLYAPHTLAAGETGYDYVDGSLIEYCMSNDICFGDYIVRIDLNPNSSEHDYINVYAYSDGGPCSSYNFLEDWWEGQKTIQIVALKRLEDTFEK